MRGRPVPPPSAGHRQRPASAPVARATDASRGSRHPRFVRTERVEEAEMYADAGEHGLHDHALLEGSVRVSRDVPESLREHLMAEHGRDLYDLMRSPDCLASLHRFE